MPVAGGYTPFLRLNAYNGVKAFITINIICRNCLNFALNTFFMRKFVHLLIAITCVLHFPDKIKAQSEPHEFHYADPSSGVFSDPFMAEQQGRYPSLEWGYRVGSAEPETIKIIVGSKWIDGTYRGWIPEGDENEGSYLQDRQNKKFYRWYHERLTEVSVLPKRRLNDHYGLMTGEYYDGFERVEYTIKPMPGANLLKMRIKGVDHTVMRAITNGLPIKTAVRIFETDTPVRAYLERVKRDGKDAFIVYRAVEGEKQAIILGTFSPNELGEYNPDLPPVASPDENNDQGNNLSTGTTELKYEKCTIKPLAGNLLTLTIKGVSHKVMRAVDRNATKEAIDYFDKNAERQMYYEKVTKEGNVAYTMYMVANDDNGGKLATIMGTVPPEQLLPRGDYDLDILSH